MTDQHSVSMTSSDVDKAAIREKKKDLRKTEAKVEAFVELYDPALIDVMGLVDEEERELVRTKRKMMKEMINKFYNTFNSKILILDEAVSAAASVDALPSPAMCVSIALGHGSNCK